MEVANIPYKFASPWAVDATTGYITSAIPATASGAAASQQLGFPPITAAPTGSGGIPPNIADINGLGLYLTLWAQWQQAGGPIAYDATFASNTGGYPKGAVLVSSANPLQFWLCTADNNTTNPDGGSPANWTNLQPFAKTVAYPTGRASGNVYTNSTGKPMFVTVDLLSGGTAGCAFLIGGQTSSQFTTTAGQNITLYGMVPAGFTYEVTEVSFAYTLNGWLETW